MAGTFRKILQKFFGKTPESLSVRCRFAPPSGRNLQGHFLVDFSRFFPHSFGSFSRFFSHFQSTLVNFSQFLSIFVSFKQVIQDKHARISHRQEGGAKQHPISELPLELPSRVRLGTLKPYTSRRFKPPEHFQNSLQPYGAPLFFRSGSGEGLSELVMEFGAVLRGRGICSSTEGTPKNSLNIRISCASILKGWAFIMSPLPNIATSSSPKNAIREPQKPFPGTCQKIPRNSGIPGMPKKGRSGGFREIHSGDPERAFWDDIPWRMRTAKVDMLGTGDGYANVICGTSSSSEKIPWWHIARPANTSINLHKTIQQASHLAASGCTTYTWP